jgi:hypothetical protein
MNRGKRHHFIELAVHKGHSDLNAVDAVFARKINGGLGVLKIERFERVRGPFSRALEIQLRADVLKQYFHKFNFERSLPDSKRRLHRSARPARLEPGLASQ